MTEIRMPQKMTKRRAFTLVELMVVIAIIAALATLILYAGSKIIAGNKPTQCKSQLKLLSDAIKRYSDAWPAWKIGGVQIADKGYPDWCGARLFASPTYSQPSDTCWAPNL